MNKNQNSPNDTARKEPRNGLVIDVANDHQLKKKQQIFGWFKIRKPGRIKRKFLARLFNYIKALSHLENRLLDDLRDSPVNSHIKQNDLARDIYSYGF